MMLRSLYHVQNQHMINIRRSPNTCMCSSRLHSLYHVTGCIATVIVDFAGANFLLKSTRMF